ncbi:hypothetical protein [Chitinimonas sp.]|uniref:hypothetical protein n=1 Tax=Chitinimonas sp. TaxID=1934313 RepID=UPI002F941495
MVIFAAPVFALVLSVFGYGVIHEHGASSKKPQSSVVLDSTLPPRPGSSVVAVELACLDQGQGCRQIDASPAATTASTHHEGMEQTQ